MSRRRRCEYASIAGQRAARSKLRPEMPGGRVAAMSASVQALAGRGGQLLGARPIDAAILDREGDVPTVLRLHLGSDGQQMASVVVKQAATFDPADRTPRPKTAWALFNEWAALETLADAGVA